MPQSVAKPVALTSVLPSDEIAAALQVDSQLQAPRNEPTRFSYEIGGMTCPDCLNKLRRALRPLQGVELISLDYIRAFGEAECHPDTIEPQAVVNFLSRASGLGIRLNQQTSPNAGGNNVLVLSIQFDRLPPATALSEYDVVDIWSDHRDRWTKAQVEKSHGPGEVKLVLRADRTDQPEPRAVLKILSAYGPKLIADRKNRHQVRIDRDIVVLSMRTIASAIFTLPELVLVWATQLPHHGSTTYRGIELGLASCVIIIAEPIYSGSFRSAWYLREPDLGVLTTVSTWSTYIFSVIAFSFQAVGKPFGDPFFETVGLLVTLVFLGRAVQALTRKMAFVATESVAQLQPKVARLMSNEQDSRETSTACEVDVRLLHYDDTIRVSEREIVPTDGLIIEGTADLDESSITGESAPVTRIRGSAVLAGAKVVQGSIDVSVTRLVCNNSLSAVVQTLTRAQNSGSKYQDLADRKAAILLPIATLLGNRLFPDLARNQSWTDSAVNGIKHAIAVMAVACPSL
ncbi:hypothetical protein I317_03086 [Kwoniella heveanensis CBS 569]|nr:hypothetical protein I317_03086 [Kwoniella heveanensis CBS 569]